MRAGKKEGVLGVLCPQEFLPARPVWGGKRFRNSALAEYQNRKIFVSLTPLDMKLSNGVNWKNFKWLALLIVKFLLALDSLLTQRFSEPFPPPVPLCGTTDGTEISFPNPFLISAPSVEKNQKRWQGKKSGGESKKQSFALVYLFNLIYNYRWEKAKCPMIS